MPGALWVECFFVHMEKTLSGCPTCAVNGYALSEALFNSYAVEIVRAPHLCQL